MPAVAGLLATRMLAALAPLADTCRDRRVIVVCPAPGVRLPAASPGDVVYAVNGGLGCVPDRPVDIWQVNGRADRMALRIEPGPLRCAWLDQGQNRTIPGLVVFMRDVEGFGTLKELQARGCQMGWIVNVERKFRGPLLEAVDIVDPKGGASAGVMAICLLLLVGAAHIVACGFSRQTGYAYLPDHTLTTRPQPHGHLQYDLLVTEQLARQYRSRLSTTSPDLVRSGFQEA